MNEPLTNLCVSLHLARVQVLTLMFFFFSAPAFAQPVLYIGSALISPLSNSEQTGLVDKLTHELFARIGQKIMITPLQGERSIVNANLGINDGDLLRINGIETLYPNLIKVPEVMFNFEFVVFTKNRSIRPNNWQELKPYSVGLIKGWKILEDKARSASVFTLVDNAENLFSMLQKGRIDLALYERLEGETIIMQRGMDDIHAVAEPLAVREMYLYLHKRHEKLIPELTAALKKMKRDGVYQRIINNALTTPASRDSN